MRVATGRKINPGPGLLISIHATHAGGDVLATGASFAMKISIHATHAGGDAGCFSFSPDKMLFQSTPPMRVATTYLR